MPCHDPTVIFNVNDLIAPGLSGALDQDVAVHLQETFTFLFLNIHIPDQIVKMIVVEKIQ